MRDDGSMRTEICNHWLCVEPYPPAIWNGWLKNGDRSCLNIFSAPYSSDTMSTFVCFELTYFWAFFLFEVSSIMFFFWRNHETGEETLQMNLCHDNSGDSSWSVKVFPGWIFMVPWQAALPSLATLVDICLFQLKISLFSMNWPVVSHILAVG